MAWGYPLLISWDTGPFGIGRLARITDASGSTEYRYDAHGRVTERINTVRGTTLPLLMGYDADGQLASLMHADGREISYSRDAAGRISAVTLINPDGSETALATDIRWSPFGPLRQLTYGNGLVHTRSHDRSGRVTAITTPGVQSVLLGWDATDNLTALTDGLSPSLSQLFAYDPLHRLTQAQGGYGLQAFAYDALGNRTRLTTDVSITDYAYAQDSNRLASVDGTAYTYDAAGNTLTDGARQFSYDARNRMAEADGHRYGYNALNLRVFKPRIGVAGDITGDGQVTEQDLGLLQQALRGDVPTTMAMDCNQDGVVDQRDTACIARKIGSFRNQGQGQGQGRGNAPSPATATPVQLGWVLFVYDDNGQLIGEYDEQGNPLRLYVWLENMPIAMLTNNGIHYLHTDHLHTPRVATDATGAISWQADYTPFGEVTETVSQIEMNLRFPGQYHDRETGLHQNWHREYAPHLGRYTQSDPIGLDGGINAYEYGLANPLALFDSQGLSPESEQSCCNRVIGESWSDTWGTVACCNGSHVVCVNPMLPSTGDGTADRSIRRCVENHEARHIDEEHVGPCAPCGEHLARVQTPTWTRASAECAATASELNCLRTARRSCARSQPCLRALEARARDVTLYRGRWGCN